MIAEEQKYSRWKKHEKKTATDTRSGSEIINRERQNVFQRAAENRNVEAIDDARASASPSQRMNQRGQKKTEGFRNRFGDSVDVVADPKDKMQKPAAWNGDRVERTATGRPMSRDLRELRDEMRNDKKVSNRAAGRAPSDSKPQVVRPAPTTEDIQAFVLYLAAAHPEWPIDERRGPNDGSAADARYREAIIVNATNLHRIWRTLKQRGVCDFDLAGLILSFDVAKEGNFLDDGKPRVRGFGNRQLINIADEPGPDPQQEDAAVQAVLGLVRSGRARLEKMRPATETEEAEIRNLRAMPFSELRKAAGK